MPLRHLLHSLLLSEPWRVSLHCSAVPLAAQDDVECLAGSTSLLDVEGVMLKIQTWSEKKEDISTTRTGTYLCRLKTRLQVQNPTIEK